MSLYQDGSGLPSKNHYTDKDTLRKYEKAISESFATVFGEKDSEEFKSYADKIVAFEKELKSAEMDPEDIQDETKTYLSIFCFYLLISYNPVAVSNLTNTLPYVSFESVIQHLTGKPLPKTILLTSPTYLESVNRLLGKTPKGTIQAYLLWTTMRGFLGHTSASTRKPWEDFSKVLAGIDPNVKKERWKTCVREMDYTLGFLAGEFYVRKQFSGDAKERGKLVIEQIKDAFVERFDQLDWVDEETREVAVRKVKNLRVKVGYNDASPNMTDPVDLAKYYEKVKIKKGTFFENNFSVVKYRTEKAFSSAGEPVDKEEWGMTPQVVPGR
jgi:endothelin-converting enzyme